MMRSTTINSCFPLFLCLMGFGLIAASCEGPAGPEGPRGFQGEQGPEGPRGPEGNANIMYSEWMDIEWSEDSSDSQKEMGIRESRITVDFLNAGGFVLMFIKAESNGIVQLYTLPLETGNGNFLYRFNTFAAEGDDGGLLFYILSLDGTAIPEEAWKGFQIRYVLIPGSVNLNAKGFDMQDCEQVAGYYGILG